MAKHEVMQVLEDNTDWLSIDTTMLRKKILNAPEEAGRLFTLFLKNGCESVEEISKIITINRSDPFDSVAFLKNNWDNQHAGGVFIDFAQAEEIERNWEIESEDIRSLSISEIDIGKIYLDSSLTKPEHSITIKERITRLKNSGQVMLDAAVFKFFIDNPQLIPSSFKKRFNNNPISIYFDGTILKDGTGEEYVLYIYFLENKLHWHFAWTGSFCGHLDCSAVL